MGRLVTISRGPRNKSTGIKVTGARGHWGKTLGAVLKSAKKVLKSATFDSVTQFGHPSAKRFSLMSNQGKHFIKFDILCNFVPQHGISL